MLVRKLGSLLCCQMVSTAMRLGMSVENPPDAEDRHEAGKWNWSPPLPIALLHAKVSRTPTVRIYPQNAVIAGPCPHTTK